MEQQQMSIQEIEDYIVDGIKKYKWSDEFLLKDLARQGYTEEDARKLIAKVKKERHVSNKSFFEDEGDENKASGTFETILIAIVVGGALSFFYPLVTHNSLDHSFYGWIDTITGAFWFLFSLYAVIQVHRKKPDAIFLLKAYIIACFVSNVLGFILGVTTMSSIYFNNPIRIVIMLAYCIGFYIYLCRSEQVERLFPKEKRKIFLWDKILASMFFLLPVILILIAIFTSPNISNDSEHNNISTTAEDIRQKMDNYVKKTKYSYDKSSTISYNKQNHTLSLNLLVDDDLYIDETKSNEIIKTAYGFWSRSTVIMVAIDEMSSKYDSLIFYYDLAKPNLKLTIQRPNGTTLLNTTISYNEVLDLGKQSKDIVYNTCGNDLIASSVYIANCMCPMEIDEGLVLQKIIFNRENHQCHYTLQVDDELYDLTKEDYLSIIDYYISTIGNKDLLKNSNTSLKIVLLGKRGNTLYEKTFSPEEL